MIAAIFLLAEVAEPVIDPAFALVDPNFGDSLFRLIELAGSLYWLFCISAYHTVLKQVPGWKHPITPLRAVGFHFIPFYNLYWVFKWPSEIATFVNHRLSEKRMTGAYAGFLVLVGSLLGRFFDVAVGLVLIFSAGIYISRRLREALTAPQETVGTVGVSGSR
ncbi:MAG: hypothetical protein ACRD5I_14015 [Candidatus Acidiferrales bacterium]